MYLSFDTPIQYLKGVGPRMGEFLGRKGIARLQDLLEYYPRAYEDRRRARNIRSLVDGELVSLKARILKVNSYQIGKRRRIYDVIIGDESGQIACKFFRVPFKGYFERFRPGLVVEVVGKTTIYRGRVEFHHPDITEFKEDSTEDSDKLVPLYSETEGLTSRKVQALVSKALHGLKESQLSIDDPLPPWLRQEFQLVSKMEALTNIHQPPKNAGIEFTQFKTPYHDRIKFEEFFWLELFLALNQSRFKKNPGIALQTKRDLTNKIVAHLPFQLTNDQKKSVEEIFSDLNEPHPMHRLVQGDVGSGKTLVAFLAAAMVIENGYQVALMVPTEILAKQHWASARKIFEPLGVEVELFVSDRPQSERQEAFDNLKSGKTKLAIGTQALIQSHVEFKNLALVIVDEQHRFGVEQRDQLKQKGVSPHFLLMTATPIPRSLALTIYGDLELSVIREKPPGRSPIVTRVTFQNKRPQVLDFMQKQIALGRQAYHIFPLVEESEKMDLKNAVDECEKLKKEFPKIRFGLLHGRLSAQEKEQIMLDFRNKKLDVLVSTTVIEVGVDVPNSTLMIVEHAERFGLSQLHQLRGRVGRGSLKSFCVLIMGYAVSEESKYRVQLMEKTSDGFELAEEDLRLRGPGEFLGKRQSGMPGFKMADIVRDYEILKQARLAAQKLVQLDPEIKKPEHALIHEEIYVAKHRFHWLGIG